MALPLLPLASRTTAIRSRLHVDSKSIVRAQHVVNKISGFKCPPDELWSHQQFLVRLEDHFPVRRRRLFFSGLLRSLTPDGRVPKPLTFLQKPLSIADLLNLETDNLRGICSLSTPKRRQNVTLLLREVGKYKQERLESCQTLPRIASIDIDRSPRGRVFDKVVLYDEVAMLKPFGRAVDLMM